MAKSLLSKSQSGVFLMLYTLLFCFFVLPSHSRANGNGQTGNPMSGFGQTACTPQNVDAFAAKECKAEPPESSKIAYDEWKQCYERIRKETCGGSSSSGPCADAVKEWDTAKKEFVNACSTAKITTAGGKGGDIACAPSMRKCTHCDSAAESRPSGVVDCGEGDYEADDSDSTSSSDILSQITSAGGGTNTPMQMTPDLNADKRRFSFCPSLAAAELKTWQDEYKDAKKNVEDLQTKITKLTEELETIKTDAEKKNVELQDKSEDLQTKAKEEAQKATENLEEAQKQMANDVEKLNEEITKENSQARQLELGRVQAQTALSDTISRLDLQCHASALQRVDQERAKKLQQMQNSTYSAGDMNSLMSGVGLSSRQQNQLTVDKYFQFCQRDRAYTMALASARKALDMALQQADEGKRSINARITALNAKINKIKTSEASQAMKRTYDRLTKIQETMNKELNKLNREKQQSEQQFTRKFQIKSKELQQQQAKLTEEEAYLKQKKNYLAMKTQMSKGMGNTSEEKVNEAMNKYTSVSAAATAVMTACCPNNGTNSKCDGPRKFLLEDDPNSLTTKTAATAPTTGTTTPEQREPAANPQGVAPAPTQTTPAQIRPVPSRTRGTRRPGVDN